jgi:GT2 family glycosyltransferase
VNGFEVIVADGMSDDGTRDILAQLQRENPGLRVVDNPGRIVSSGLNAAIREGRGSIIIRMDAHTEYASNYVKQCVLILETTRADNVGGPARTRTDGYAQAAIAAAYHSPFSVGGAHFHNVDYEGYVDTVTYGCWRREIFDRIGFFDESLVRNQDDEFNLRLRRAGGKIWQSPRLQSWYKPRSTLRSLFWQYAQYGYWKVRVIQKHRIPASARHLVPACFLLLLLVLPMLSFCSVFALQAWFGLIGAYLAIMVLASLKTANKNEWKLLPVLPLAFACFHFGYGLGFLSGIWDFVLLRRQPASAFSRLTRPSSS